MRLQIERIAASVEFGPSRQLRDFLRYCCEAAIEGRKELTQFEIATEVLSRKDFNPLDDTSVRRVAALTRKRLERYYSGSGIRDSLRISFPLRSYLPVFEVIEHAEAASPLAEQVGPTPRARFVWAALATLLLAALVVWRFFTGVDHPTDASFTIESRLGDISGKSRVIPPASILLGPKLGESEDAVVRMRFAPDEAYQQAGLLIYQDPDNYVKLARHFTDRTQWEFNFEVGGKYDRPVGTWTYDPFGQNGQPVWLSIHRDKLTYTALVSHDGISWQPVANPLTLPHPLVDARIAVYSLNGLADAKSKRAYFDQVSTAFSSLSDPGQGSEAGWQTNVISPEGMGPRFEGPTLRFFAERARPVTWDLTRQVPSGDWTIETKLDQMSLSGTAAGLIVRGKRGRLRLLRWPVSGGSISAEYFVSAPNSVSRPDFPGRPAVTLRISSRSGELTTDFSRDEVDFVSLPMKVRLSELGDDQRLGIAVQVTSWNQVSALPPATFYYIRLKPTHFSPVEPAR